MASSVKRDSNGLTTARHMELFIIPTGAFPPVSENREGIFFPNVLLKFLYFQTLSVGQSKMESGFNVL